jgi:outer membrane biosynthesis protein TonB
VGGPDSWRRIALTGIVGGVTLAFVAALVAAFIEGSGSGSLDENTPTAVAPAAGPVDGSPVDIPTPVEETHPATPTPEAAPPTEPPPTAPTPTESPPPEPTSTGPPPEPTPTAVAKEPTPAPTAPEEGEPPP